MGQACCHADSPPTAPGAGQQDECPSQAQACCYEVERLCAIKTRAIDDQDDDTSRVYVEAVDSITVPGQALNLTTLEKEEARRVWEEKQAEDERKLKFQEEERKLKLQEYLRELELTRAQLRCDPAARTRRIANRYGAITGLPKYQPGKHVPVLGLLNCKSGAGAGKDVMELAVEMDCYRYRILDIMDVMKSRGKSGGLMDLFRFELNAAKEEAKALRTRPRLISGGGDGTASFALLILFLALKADNRRADEGLRDTGNGFIWTDEEMAAYLPALAQLPLGSANDFANILGWGQKYPGDGMSPQKAVAALNAWIEAVLDPASKVVNFDLWGIMPHGDSAEVDFKLAELDGRRGFRTNLKLEESGRREVHLKKTDLPVPFFICLYFSAGFGAYMTARFQLNRHNTPAKNRAEYLRQALAIVEESTPPQISTRLLDMEIDCEGEPYFPPRREEGTKGSGYREVGFYNINWQAHAFHGADRAPLGQRCCPCGSGSIPREPVLFNDGKLDMFRWKFMSLLKNPGLKFQTDKKKDMSLRYAGGRGKGIFFQWDGEARFAFSPTGAAFNIFIRRVMTIPVVLGPSLDPRLTGINLNSTEPASFKWQGENEKEKEAVRQRTLQYIQGELNEHLNATSEDIASSQFPMLPPQDEEEAPQEAPK